MCLKLKINRLNVLKAIEMLSKLRRDIFQTSFSANRGMSWTIGPYMLLPGTSL